MSKDIIFYSEYCDYSKQTLELIKKYKLTDTLIMVCVDDENIKIPPFLEAVPTIYLQKSKSIIIDDRITEYIEKRKPQDSSANIGDWDSSFGSNSMTNFASLDEGADDGFLGSSGCASINYDFSVKQMDEGDFKKRTMEDLEKERRIEPNQTKSI